MQKDIYERFKLNIEQDEDEIDQQNLINIYSNFNRTVLMEGAVDEETDKDFFEDIEFISKELKKFADCLFINAFS